ncbi:CU044_5270 family protein [Streptomyces sp. NPDC001966]
MNTDPSRRTAHQSGEETERTALTNLLPAPSVPDLPRDRALLLKQALLNQAEQPARSRRPRPRLVRFLVPAVAAALAVGTVVTVGITDTPDSTPGNHQATPPHATGLLDRIALAARGTDAPAVRADQFVYVRSWVAYAGQSAGGGLLTLPPVHTREVWLSADGSRPGLIRQEGEPDSKVPAPDPTDPSVSNPSHTYVDCLPTDPDALLNLIRTQTLGQGQDPDQRAFEAIGDLLSETWAPPRVSAALYRAAARIPGVTVAGTAKDAAGREGVTVARTSYGEQTQWIFDPATHAFLGRRTVLVEPNGGSPAGTVVATSAVLATAAADHAGDVP